MSMRGRRNEPEETNEEKDEQEEREERKKKVGRRALLVHVSLRRTKAKESEWLLETTARVELNKLERENKLENSFFLNTVLIEVSVWYAEKKSSKLVDLLRKKARQVLVLEAVEPFRWLPFRLKQIGSFRIHREHKK